MISKAFYKSWRKESTYSPALGRFIKITNLGWNHLVTNKRTKLDVERRLWLLPFARVNVEISTTIQNVKEKFGILFYEITAVQEVSQGKRTRITVIISEKNSQLYFLSVMEKRLG